MESFRLSNNIKVVFNKTSGVNVVSMRIFTPVSVINETSDNAGISYLTAKLMTQSTKNRSNEILANETESIGADLSGDADYDTALLSMTFLSEYFDKAADILADAVLNPAFDEKELSFEKQNVIAALSCRRDNIGNIAYDEFAKLFYHNTSYAMPVLGAKETVSKISCKDLADWHRYSYNTSNILISVAGNIGKNIVKESLEKYFASVPDGKKVEKPVFNIKQHESIKKEIKGKFNQAYIYTGFPAPAISSKDFVSIKVANAILGGKMTSRLFVELRENLGLAYEVGAVYTPRKAESYLAVYIGLDKKNIELTLKKTDKILKDFCTLKVDEEELKNTKTYIKGLYIMSRQTVSKQSYYYGWREIVGQGCEYDNEYLKQMEKITAQNVLDAINKVFLSYSVSVIVNPEA
ncbi:putative zinc protease YmxG [Endomicrobiia bacterium]|uniref:M16 family metallopeptidase n=1 Tax=Endomicrobium trichonymphae TaxID=1408204 RepID=UPI000865079D|nr:pitrilysin family protein [Candidatus Endomicrobium trichonymphae]BAV58629.1 zinc protease [Candidatus Endomicrobium trichonymphae]GHT22293.1 putative zinc protease YmxG [Endomicrobiia bacterium]